MSTLTSLLEKLDDVSLWAMDETNMRLEPNNFYGWSPIGAPHIIEHNGSHKGLNIIGATEILNHNHFVYDAYSNEETTICSSHIITYLNKLLEYDKARGINVTFVVLDNAGCHKSKEVRAFAMENKNKLVLIYQPPYSPQLNPQENVWNMMKKFLNSSFSYKSTEELLNYLLIFQQYTKENICKVNQLVYAHKYYK